jgi:photosystem II stability/assembly factor-like uncharacterized protein
VFVGRMSWLLRVVVVLATAAVGLSLAPGGSGAGAAPVVTGSASRRVSVVRSVPNPIAGDKYFDAQRRGLSAVGYLRAVREAAALRAQARVALRGVGVPAWAPLGPAPITGGIDGGNVSGRVTSVAVVPSGPSVGEIFAGAAGGGVWSSANNGASWTPRSDTAPSLAIGALAVDGTNPAVIYAATGETNGYQLDSHYGEGILKSTDGGLTWSTLDPGGVFSGRHIASITIDPADDHHLFAGTSKGLYESTNQGDSWAKPTDPSYEDGPVTAVVEDPSHPRTIYVAVGGRAGHLPSAGGIGIEKSTDGGTTFNTLGGGLPSAASFGTTALAIAASNPNVLYAAVSSTTVCGSSSGFDGLFVSSNGGITWTKLTNTPAYTTSSYAYSQSVIHDQSCFDNTLAVDPTNPNHVLAGGIALIETTDGGNSWTNVNGKPFAGPPSLLHEDFHALSFSGGQVTIGSDGGVYRYDPTTHAVRNLNTNLSITQFYPGISQAGNGARILAGSQDNGTVLYRGGTSWPEVFGGDGGASAIDPLDHNVQLAELPAFQKLSLTSDNWRTPPADITPHAPSDSGALQPMTIVPNAATPSNPTVYWGARNLYVTHNPTERFGPTWRQVTHHPSTIHPGFSAPPAVTAVAVAPSNRSVIYVGWDDGTLQVSSNGARSFHSLSAPDGGHWITHIAVNPSDAASIAISLSDGPVQRDPFPPQILVSGNATARHPRWSDITGNLPAAVPSNSVAYDGSALVAATDVGVFSTAAASGSRTHWIAVGSGLPNVQAVDLLVEPNGAMLVATHGRGIWRLRPTVLGAYPTGTYAGRTSQHLSFRFLATYGKVMHVMTADRVSCNNRRHATFAEGPFELPINHNGQFNKTFRYAGGSISIAGKLTAKHASGTLSDHFVATSPPHALCQSGNVRWSAQPR